MIQQLDVPEAIYNDPANLFVAGFIGSPSMNLVQGDLVDGSFTGEGLRFPTSVGGNRKSVVLGIRPEDVRVVGPGEGLFDAPVYAFELTGESVLVTVTVGKRHFAARADRHFRCRIGDQVGVRFDAARTYLFDQASEARIRT